MTADHLTIAYIALGAADAIAECGHDAVADIWRGPELKLVEEVIAWAGLLDALAETADLVGCFVYEVAQPFGQELTRALLTDSQCDARAVAPGIALRLVQDARAGSPGRPAATKGTCKSCGRGLD